MRWLRISKSGWVGPYMEGIEKVVERHVEVALVVFTAATLNGRDGELRTLNEWHEWRGSGPISTKVKYGMI